MSSPNGRKPTSFGMRAMKSSRFVRNPGCSFELRIFMMLSGWMETTASVSKLFPTQPQTNCTSVWFGKYNIFNVWKESWVMMVRKWADVILLQPNQYSYLVHVQHSRTYFNFKLTKHQYRRIWHNLETKFCVTNVQQVFSDCYYSLWYWMYNIQQIH